MAQSTSNRDSTGVGHARGVSRKVGDFSNMMLGVGGSGFGGGISEGQVSHKVEDWVRKMSHVTDVSMLTQYSGGV